VPPLPGSRIFRGTGGTATYSWRRVEDPSQPTVPLRTRAQRPQPLPVRAGLCALPAAAVSALRQEGRPSGQVQQTARPAGQGPRRWRLMGWRRSRDGSGEEPGNSCATSTSATVSESDRTGRAKAQPNARTIAGVNCIPSNPRRRSAVTIVAKARVVGIDHLARGEGGRTGRSGVVMALPLAFASHRFRRIHFVLLPLRETCCEIPALLANLKRAAQIRPMSNSEVEQCDGEGGPQEFRPHRCRRIARRINSRSDQEQHPPTADLFSFCALTGSVRPFGLINGRRGHGSKVRRSSDTQIVWWIHAPHHMIRLHNRLGPSRIDGNLSASFGNQQGYAQA
jgi:hypothetical protein